MKSFTDLQAWQFGIELLQEIYEITKGFPESERYELTKQLRSSTKSILANLAEGFGRYTFPDKANKYIIARGECTETEAHLLVAIAIKFVTAERASKALELTRRVGRLLSGLVATCQKRS